jgi:hypothetical protein
LVSAGNANARSGIPLRISDLNRKMERLWSRAGAAGDNWKAAENGSNRPIGDR